MAIIKSKKSKLKQLTLLFIFLLLPTAVFADQGKLLGTAGLIQLEGSGGGGIVPWATISGYESRDSVSYSAFNTDISLDNFRLNTKGISIGYKDSIEFSFARQTFDLSDLGGEIRQNVIGIKKKIYGDIIYSKFPQMSIGIQHKSLQDTVIANAVGAKDTSGIDIYFSATKAYLASVSGRNFVWNLTARATQANQLGLLGFGHVNNDNYKLMLEASIGLFLSSNTIVGYEYRQKPDMLGLGEDHWSDYFISYIPNKNINLTLAYANAGSIAGSAKQNGIYFSMSGHF